MNKIARSGVSTNDLYVALRRLVNSLSDEAFFLDSEKGRAMSAAIDLLDKIDKPGK